MEHDAWWQTYLDGWTALPFHDLIAAIAILGTALLLGVLAARISCRYLLPALAPRQADIFSSRLMALTRSGMTALVLAAFLGIRGLDPGADLVLAAGLAIAVATFAYQIARSLGLESRPAWLVAVALLFIVLASRLGGMGPLIAGLDRANMAIGTRRISLLDIVNAVGLSFFLFLAARAVLRRSCAGSAAHVHSTQPNGYCSRSSPRSRSSPSRSSSVSTCWGLILPRSPSFPELSGLRSGSACRRPLAI